MKEGMIVEELVIPEELAKLMDTVTSLLRRKGLCIERSHKKSRGVSC
jgi:hypothetical protein